ncbi:DnaJ domain-containing protein [Terrisporobacter sp.]
MTLMEDLLLKGYIDENIDEGVKNSTADYIVRLLTFLAKSDGYISCKERDYIINYMETFEMNECEETWLFAQFDYARFNEYDKKIIVLLKNTINKLLDKKNLDFKILYMLINISLLDNENLNDTQIQIIGDFVEIFKLDADECDKIYNIIINKKVKPKENSTPTLDECYEILGLDKNCSQYDLKKRYAYLTKSYHPDKYNIDEMPNELKKELEDIYKKINFAYDRLKNTF